MKPAAPLSVTLLLLGAASALHVGGRPAVPPPLRVAALRPASLRMDADAEEEPQLDRSAPIPTGTGGAAPSSKPAPAAAAPGLSPCSIKVVGVGGGGGNTINRMVQEGPGVERSTFLEYVACNTDIQALSASLADRTIQLGRNQARGLGAGGIPAVGRASAIDAAADIEAIVSGTDMVFVTAGMGGGTGSGAAPVIAELAKQCGCLTVGIVTKPFLFEGRRRMSQAVEAIDSLQEHVDILIVVSNDKLLEIVPEGVPLQEAFSLADEILRQGITGISDIVVKPGLINVDFADVRSVMQNAGPALMGIGRGFGKTRGRDAALAAVSSPLLDFPIEKARGVVFTITGNSDMSLQEVNDVASVISSIVAPDANIIFGTSVDESYGDEIAVTVVATSFDVPADAPAAAAAAPSMPMPVSAAAAAASVPPATTERPRKFWNRF